MGIPAVAGYLHGGMTAWREERRPVERIARITVDRLLARHRAGLDDLQLLDVREDGKWRAGHVPGAVHRPYHDLRKLPPELDADRPTA